MDFNFLAFGYLFLRLAPFILVCFFTLSSIFNQDFKGFIYLIGLLFACFVTTSIGKMFMTNKPESLEICNMMPLMQDQELSSLPLSQTVFGYTFAYMLFSIIKYKIIAQNWPTLTFFPLIIIFDILWNIQYKCNSWLTLIASLAIGMGCGALWGYLISTTKTVNLQYYAGNSDKDTCSIPSKNTFKCNVYKNGALIQSTINK